MDTLMNEARLTLSGYSVGTQGEGFSYTNFALLWNLAASSPYKFTVLEFRHATGDSQTICVFILRRQVCKKRAQAPARAIT